MLVPSLGLSNISLRSPRESIRFSNWLLRFHPPSLVPIDQHLSRSRSGSQLRVIARQMVAECSGCFLASIHAQHVRSASPSFCALAVASTPSPWPLPVVTPSPCPLAVASVHCRGANQSIKRRALHCRGADSFKRCTSVVRFVQAPSTAVVRSFVEHCRGAIIRRALPWCDRSSSCL